MTPTQPQPDDLIRQIEEYLANLPPGAADLVAKGTADFRFDGSPRKRPHLRKAPPPEVATLRIRADLDDASPPIWRRLEVRSDLTLDVVHQVLQGAFGWNDSHLHIFGLGGSPFYDDSEVFLCEFDEEQKQGTPDREVRLDETVQRVGDKLHYIYDYGDEWTVTLKLERVLPLELDAPDAVCVDGRRASPSDDSGGRVDAESLAEILEDPAHFDLNAANAGIAFMRRLGATLPDLRAVDLHPSAVAVLELLSSSKADPALVADVLALLSAEHAELPTDDVVAALRPVQWLLDAAHPDGITLTKAGYVPPTLVKESAAVLPAFDGWFGSAASEYQAQPLLWFREMLQHVGLLRKQKGVLHLTAAGRRARTSTAALWSHLAARLLPAKADNFDAQAVVLIVMIAATAGDARPIDHVAQTMSRIGWQVEGGDLRSSVAWIPKDPWNILRNLDQPVHDGGPSEAFRRGGLIGPIAQRLARAALRGDTSTRTK